MVSGLPRGRQLYAEYAGGFVFRNFAGNAERFAGEGTIFLHELFGFVKDLLDSVWLDHERFDFSVVYFLLSSISASCATFEHQKKLRPQHRILRLPRDVATVKGGSSIRGQHKVACAAQRAAIFRDLKQKNALQWHQYVFSADRGFRDWIKELFSPVAFCGMIGCFPHKHSCPSSHRRILVR